MTTLDNNSALASLLEGRLVEWEKARAPQELKMLECYQDVMRIAREDDTKGTGAAKARKAQSLFIGSTQSPGSQGKDQRCPVRQWPDAV